MKILVTTKDVRLIKKQLGQKLPHVKSSHRVEAMARGLGWKSNAALRASLVCGPTKCMVKDQRFEEYLEQKGFHELPEGCLSQLVLQMMVDRHNRAAEVEDSLLPSANATRPLVSGNLWRRCWKSGLVGALTCLGLFLLVSQPVLRGFMDDNVEQMIISVEEQAARAVLTLDPDKAHEAIESLMQSYFVTSVIIRDDHGEILAGNMAERLDLDILTFSLVAMLEPDEERVYQRQLKMPDGLPGPGVIEVKVDRKQAIAASGEHTPFGLMLVACIGWWLGSHSGSIGPGRWIQYLRKRLQRLLVGHFSFQQTGRVSS